MNPLVLVHIDGAEPVLVELDDSDAGIVRSSRTGEIADAVGGAFEAGLARIRPLAEAIRAQFEDLPESPNEVSIEFGLKVGADAGIIVARSSAEANFAISLKWQR